MLTLAAADTLAGVAQTAAKVTCTVMGMELSGGVEVYKVLDQRQLPAAAATIYTVPGATEAFIRSISVVNTDAMATQTFQLFRNGLAAANAITPVFTLPIGGYATYEDAGGWKVMDASGQTLQSVAGSPSGVVPVGGIIHWSGTIAAIAGLSGWALCDGTANAPGPDLRDKFVVGAAADDAGVAKSSIRGSPEQSANATGHSHSGHADLTHAGLTIGDHTGLTHGVTIGDHPDLTHAALSHAAQTFTHADHSIASVTHTHASTIVTPADHSVASFSGTHASKTGSVPSGTFSVASQAGVNSFATSNNRSGLISFASKTGSVASATFTVASGTHTHGAATLTHAGVSIPSMTGFHAATTLSHADHSFPSMSHQDIGTHAGTAYGTHAVTPPAAHGAAGTVTHSFGQPNDHVISAHDVVSIVPSFFALAFIQRMT